MRKVIKFTIQEEEGISSFTEEIGSEQELKEALTELENLHGQSNVWYETVSEEEFS